MARPTFKLLVLANKIDWPSLPQKMDAVRTFYAPVCDLDIEIRRVSVDPVYSRYPDIDPLYIIDRGWYDSYLATPNALQADIILFITQPGTMPTFQGYMSFNNVGPWETTVFVHSEQDHTYVQGKDMGESLVLYATHELSHVFYTMVGKRDDTHIHFPVGQDNYADDPRNVLADFDFSTRYVQLEWLKDKLLAALTAIGVIRKQQQGLVADPPSSGTMNQQPMTSNLDTFLPWTTIENCRHNVRVICDQEGLTLDQKNQLSATIHCESNYNPHLVHPNLDKNGKIASTDYGIAQINDYYHIGPRKEFPSTQYVLENPEACVRWMCKQWLDGHANLWVCYLKDMYLHYSS